MSSFSAWLSARYPEMSVDLVTEGRLIDIVAEGFDIGARVADLVPSDMIAVPLRRPQRHTVVASPSYLTGCKRPRVPGDLLGCQCIRVRLPSGALYRWHFEKHGESVDVDVRGRITLEELGSGLTRSAALEGLGYCYMHEIEVADDIASGRLVRVLEHWTPPFPRLCLYYPGRRHLSAGLRAFLALAREVSAKSGGGGPKRSGGTADAR